MGTWQAVRQIEILLLEPTVLVTLVRRSNHLSYLGAVTQEISAVKTCIISRHLVVRMLKLIIRIVCIMNLAALGGMHIHQGLLF